ncbi:hypothetical protein BX600DRAFT_230378 [Xylariales sp. PMI_506]|nr:hypothetical protein BX600DRAFT_230378 [Xylariales sp. PMI_506]
MGAVHMAIWFSARAEGTWVSCGTGDALPAWAMKRLMARDCSKSHNPGPLVAGGPGVRREKGPNTIVGLGHHVLEEFWRVVCRLWSSADSSLARCPHPHACNCITSLSLSDTSPIPRSAWPWDHRVRLTYALGPFHLGRQLLPRTALQTF